MSRNPNLRQALKEASAIGIIVTRVERTGELRASLPGHPTVRFNARRKDTPRALLSLIYAARQEHHENP